MIVLTMILLILIVLCTIIIIGRLVTPSNIFSAAKQAKQILISALFIFLLTQHTTNTSTNTNKYCVVIVAKNM
jgi:hypothetical protein